MSSTNTRNRVRVPALDGLRAIAVAAVLLYHADFTWAKGGYLGVDLFFVLSGFLVTGLLLAEHERNGEVSLQNFWVRRIRRLVPAQATLLLALLIYIFLFHRPELYEFRGQAIAAVTASTNWFLIATGQSYFDQIGRPPVLRHLWSLAIEMQFYLLWPVVFGVLLHYWRKSLGVLLAVVLGIATFSILLMWLLYQSDNPSTVYYSTFTRLFGLLLGAALAIVWRPDRLGSAPIGTKGPTLDRIGIGGVVIMIISFVVMGADRGWMYHTFFPLINGFVVFSLVSVALVAVCSHPNTWLASRRALGHPVLAAIGERSYGIYLWHWPIYAFTRPGADWGLGVWPALVVRLALTLVISEACFRYVERPWHNRQMTMLDLRRVFSRPDPGELLRPIVVGVGSLIVVVALVFTALAPVHKNEIVAEIEKGEEAISNQKSAPPPSTTTSPDPTTTTSTVPVTRPDGQRIIPDFRKDNALPYVTAFGDSVMVGAAPAIIEKFGRDHVWVDAHKGRQAKGLDEIISGVKANRGLGGIVVIHIGTNGTFDEDQIRVAAEAAGDLPVVFLTARADRSWIPGVNANLKQVIPTLPNAYLIDWQTYSSGHGDWFASDGIHLTEAGRAAYANLLYESLTGVTPPA